MAICNALLWKAISRVIGSKEKEILRLHGFKNCVDIDVASEQQLYEFRTPALDCKPRTMSTITVKHLGFSCHIRTPESNPQKSRGVDWRFVLGTVLSLSGYYFPHKLSWYLQNPRSHYQPSCSHAKFARRHQTDSDAQWLEKERLLIRKCLGGLTSARQNSLSYLHLSRTISFPVYPTSESTDVGVYVLVFRCWSLVTPTR